MMKHLVRAALVIVGTAASFGLTIFGRGGFAAYFSQPALVALTVALGILVVAALFAGGIKNQAPRHRCCLDLAAVSPGRRRLSRGALSAGAAGHVRASALPRSGSFPGRRAV